MCNPALHCLGIDLDLIPDEIGIGMVDLQFSSCDYLRFLFPVLYIELHLEEKKYSLPLFLLNIILDGAVLEKEK